MPAQDVDLDDARDCFETNFFGLVAMTQAFVPFLILSKGLIINIGSVAAILPYVFGSIYNASKAAVHSYSHTLRLELEPFGVRVMVVITSSVQSRITNKDRKLPDQSMYWEIESDFQKRVKYSQHEAMTNQDYAERVVKEALKEKLKYWYWEGNNTWTIWFLWTFLGMNSMDWLMRRMFGLNKLKDCVAKREPKKLV
jgi:1-acylglycerone phosphate reductase